MANNVKRTNKRRRQRAGVPVVLAIALVVLALIMGGLIGHGIARRSNPMAVELQQANDRIMELENTLTLIGYSIDEDNPEEWTFDDSAPSDGSAELSGRQPGAGEDDLWVDDSLLSGTLDDSGDPVVVAEFDGGQLLSTEVIPEFNEQLTTQIFAGYSAEEVSDSVLQTVLSYMVGDKLVAQKAAELGLDQLTDEDMAAIKAEASQKYADQVSYYTGFVSEPGMTDDEVKSAAEAYMAQQNGSASQAAIEADLEKTWPAKKFYDYTVKDVTVTDQEVEDYYREQLESQKASFAEYPEEFEYAHINGNTILYRPEGYQAVKDLLIPFESTEDSDRAADLMDELAQLNPQSDAARVQEIETELNGLFAPLEAKAQEVAAQLLEGEDFMTLVDRYGADASMKTEPVRSEGYYLSDDSFLFSTEFIQGSLMLNNPGEVSTPLRSAAGVHLAQYVGAVPSGDVPLTDVYDAMKAGALEIKRDNYYETQLNNMLETANVKYYPERLQ